MNKRKDFFRDSKRFSFLPMSIVFWVVDEASWTKRKWPQLCLLPLPVLDTIFFRPRRDNFNIVFSIQGPIQYNGKPVLECLSWVTWPSQSYIWYITTSSTPLWYYLLNWLAVVDSSQKVLNFSQLHTLISFILGSCHLNHSWELLLTHIRWSCW